MNSGKLEVVKVCPDSGATKFVAPENMCMHIAVEPSEASKRMVKYRAANGQTIPNKGEKKVSGEDIDGGKIEAVWQIAGITKPLASVREMVEAGNRVTFDQDERGNNISGIYNKKKAIKILIELVGAAYDFEMWVEKTEKNSKSKDLGAIEMKNKYETLKEEPENEQHMSFHRLVEVRNVNTDAVRTKEKEKENRMKKK